MTGERGSDDGGSQGVQEIGDGYHYYVIDFSPAFVLELPRPRFIHTDSDHVLANSDAFLLLSFQVYMDASPRFSLPPGQIDNPNRERWKAMLLTTDREAATRAAICN